MKSEMNTFCVEQHFGPLDNYHPLWTAEYPGVYFLCRGTSIVYVGKTKNIAQRISEHAGKDFDTVMVMRVPEELLATIEMHWIQRLRPPLNRGQGPAPISKTPKLLRLTDETVRRLSQAAAKAGTSEAVYVEMVLKAQFKREGIE